MGIHFRLHLAQKGKSLAIFHNFLNIFSRKNCLFGPCIWGSSSTFRELCFWKLDFQAVIKLAASAASPPAWGAPDDGARWDDGVGRTTERDSDDGSGRSPSVGEAALAADLITA